MYSKYIKQNCFTYFLSMQYTNRCHLAIVALSAGQKAMLARRHLLIHWIKRKHLNNFSSLYLEYNSKPLLL